jgi:hypothetical protein
VSKTALIGWASVAAVVALSVSGCGSSTSGAADNSRVTGSAAPKQESSGGTGKVSVGSVGFGQDQYGGAMGVATVSNPTANAVQISVNFAAYDKAGKVLDTQSGAYVIMRSSSEQIVAQFLSVPQKAKIARVDAQVSVDDQSKDDHPSSTMEIPKVNLVKKYGSYSATGEIASHYQSTVSDAYVGVSCTNAAGDIVGGGDTFMDSNVVGGAKTPFSVDLTVSQPPKKCEAAATLSNISEAK